MRNIKSQFVTIDSRTLHGIMREISPEFNVNRAEVTRETRETHWKNPFDFKRHKVSKQKKFTGMIETDGLAMCVHCRRLKANRQVPSSILPVTKHEYEKGADPAIQKLQDSDFVVGLNPWNTNIITIAVLKRPEDCTDGNLRQKYMRLLRFSRAIYNGESGMINARKKIETWTSGMKDQMEALSEVTSRGADFEAFLKFMEVRIAHWDAL